MSNRPTRREMARQHRPMDLEWVHLESGIPPLLSLCNERGNGPGLCRVSTRYLV